MAWAELMRVLFALIAVIGLIGFCALMARKAGFVTASGGFTSRKRLAVVETLALDARRRLAIIKCDGQEHLIILGATNETVVDKSLPASSLEEDALTANDAPSDEMKNPFAALLAFQERGKKSDLNAA